MGVHTYGRRIHKSICAGHRIGQTVDGADPVRPVNRSETFDHGFCLFRIPNPEGDVLDTATKQRMRDGFASTSGAELHDPVSLDACHVAPERVRESKPVRVMPDRFSGFQENGVGPAYRARVAGSLATVRKDS